MFIEFEENIYNTDLIKEVYKINEESDYQIIICFKEQMSTSIKGIFTKNVDFNFSSKDERDYKFNELLEKLIPSISEKQLKEDIDCAMHDFMQFKKINKGI